MKNYTDVIKGIVITEKSTKVSEDGLHIVLKVDPKANKIQIRQAVEKAFDVKVKEVNTLNVRRKHKRVGRYAGLTTKYKKAYITLAEGSKINLG